MRNATRFTLFALAALAVAGCHERRPDALTDLGAALPPGVIRATAAATNYAPPDWPLNPGDTIKNDPGSESSGPGGYHVKLSALQKRFNDAWGTGVVWVASESGLSGVLPFGAEFVNVHPRGGGFIYVGHMPLHLTRRGGPRGFHHLMRPEDTPESLRGIVDPGDSRFYAEPLTYAEYRMRRDEIKRTIGYAKAAQNARSRYYGPDAVSW